MTYLLDTNIISFLLRRHAATLAALARAVAGGGRVVVCPLVDYEIRRGLLRNDARKMTIAYGGLAPRFAYAPLVEADWIRAARLWADCHRAGEPRTDSDLIIAAQALELGAALVADNTRHFACFEPHGLRLENWSAP